MDCTNCGAQRLPAMMTQGRCPRCHQHWQQHGLELVLALCSNCQQPHNEIVLGRCSPCYEYWRRHGLERSVVTW
jgi:hypothetical protein